MHKRQRNESCVGDNGVEGGKFASEALLKPSDVCTWLGKLIDENRIGNISSEEKERIIKQVETHDIDGDVLSSMTEKEIEEYLGIAKFGPRKKLYEIIRATLSQRLHSESGAAAPAEQIPQQRTRSRAVKKPKTSEKVAAPPAKPLRLTAQSSMKKVLADRSSLVKVAGCQDSCYKMIEKSAQEILDILVDTIDKVQNDDMKIWITELEKLIDVHKQQLSQKSTIVAVGDTGSGKSTLLNALLDECVVLSTNSTGRACTATIIELEFNECTSGPSYVAEVEFVTKEAWEQEIETCIYEDHDEEELDYEQSHDKRSSACKLSAVYGRAFASLLNQQPSAEDLKRMVEALSNPVTEKLGTSETIQSTNPKDLAARLEMYIDASVKGLETEQQYWPIVKRVCIKSRKWTMLRGTRLVDAPGVRDDNTARDQMVKEYLQSSDGILVIADIKRAVSNKTAKTMLNSSFRRQLFMDGHYGQLAFVATHSDVVVATELEKSFGRGKSRRELALRRCEYTTEQVKQDFQAGLEELCRGGAGAGGGGGGVGAVGGGGGAAPDGGGAAEGGRRGEDLQLPVYCVSAMEYQKLANVRKADGKPETFESAEETQIPKLQTFIMESALRRKCNKLLKFVEALTVSTRRLQCFLQQSQDDSVLSRAAVQAAAQELSSMLASLAAQLQTRLDGRLHKLVAPLNFGIDSAAASSFGTAQDWGSKLHFATYKATLARNGAFRRDMNEELAAPLFSAISATWDETFNLKIPKEIQRFVAGLNEELGKACLKHKWSDEQLETVQAHKMCISREMRDIAEAMQEEIQAEQQRLSRSITSEIQTAMGSAYMRARAESGKGSHRRRRDILENHVASCNRSLFTKAAAQVAEALKAVPEAKVKPLSSRGLALGQRLSKCFPGEGRGDSSAAAAATAASGCDDKKAVGLLSSGEALRLRKEALERITEAVSKVAAARDKLKVVSRQYVPPPAAADVAAPSQDLPPAVGMPAEVQVEVKVKPEPRC